jgi:hypothetical protein
MRASAMDVGELARGAGSCSVSTGLVPLRHSQVGQTPQNPGTLPPGLVQTP